MICVFANHFHILIESDVTSIPVSVSCSFDTVTSIVRFAEIHNGENKITLPRLDIFEMLFSV